ncbi:hypothetical protein [Actinomadura geliboluensis]|uniref:Uncharacterized protein n=1 Tax=Actinomadura geliboluensis TaxID=882440 RepID=A0A5S4GXY1_9ACTN|nr:hypothetical protein [Actinomadura geliboluensis]TMR37391.1 hypothetical protein ETD96_18715 [Actinomadura geliboluensis]
MDTVIISSGDDVVVTDAYGREHRVQALSGVERRGHDFPIVWIARPLAAGGTDRVPWPAESVRPAPAAPTADGD